MVRLFDLNNAPLVDLAETVLDGEVGVRARYKAFCALKARLPELNGQGWVAIGQDGMVKINEALRAKFCDACLVTEH